VVHPGVSEDLPTTSLAQLLQSLNIFYQFGSLSLVAPLANLVSRLIPDVLWPGIKLHYRNKVTLQGTFGFAKLLDVDPAIGATNHRKSSRRSQ
jgi:hypothetical protein